MEIVNKKIVSWFSCGIASAVATKIALHKYSDNEIIIARCIVENEHSDNDRFHEDCEKWFDREIIKLRSIEFKDCWEVWEKRKYISGIKGAPCTVEMKKAVRWKLEKQYNPDYQIFGYTVEEKNRAERFVKGNPDVNLLLPLIDEKITKKDCKDIIEGAEINIPEMYKLGFSNNNCICCAKATSIVYWARCRALFPNQFDKMDKLSRRLGCRLTRYKGKRIFLDEIPNNIDWKKKDKENIECGVLCSS